MNSMNIIKSVQNEKIKEISKLKNKKNRIEQNRFLVNGIKCSYEYLKLKTIYQEYNKAKKENQQLFFNDIIINSELEYIIIEENVYSKYLEYINTYKDLSKDLSDILSNNLLNNLLVEEDIKFKLYKYIYINQEKIMIVSKEVFNKLTEHKNFEGVLLCIKYKYMDNVFNFNIDSNNNITNNTHNKLDYLVDKIKKYNDIVVLENVNDPGNLGSILRTMSATGNKLLILAGDCVSQFSEKVIRSSMGAVFKIDIENVDFNTFKEILNQESIKEEYITVCTSLKGENLYTKKEKNVDNFNKNIIVFGNEANGLSLEMLKLIKNKITIPMEENVNSLNLSISVAIILYELYRRKKYCIHNTNKIDNDV